MSSMRKRFGLANSGRFKQADDISISDSLCSGVLRDAAGMGDSVSSSNNIGRSIGHSSHRSAPPPPPAPLPGGVADFNSQYNKKPTNESEGSVLTASSGGGPSLERQHWAQPPPPPPPGGSSNSFASSPNADNAPHYPAAESSAAMQEDQMKREQRKERVREKLDRYKRDQKQLKQACVAMEAQLAQTTDKLREVDTRAASKIDSLELELRETRDGMERVARQGTKEVTDQSECIKTLGKKLIRQAHVIKRQKAAVEQYKCQLEGLEEEMAMQDERDQRKDEESGELRERLEEAKEQKIKMQNMLQENIEEMMDLKSETERDAKNIRDLEFHLQQKEATLDRVVQEVSQKAVKISELEEQLEEKDRELGGVNAKYKESENSVAVMQKELESASSEIEELRCKYASWKTTSSAGGDGAVGGSVAASSMGDRRTSLASIGRSSSILGFGLNRAASARPLSFEEGEDPIETFEAELASKDATIQTLDGNCKEHEETIKTLRSDMVKMSSTYKQDSYLKRKEIAKLKKQNAEFALKLRALEKAFKCVNATESMSVVGNKFHGHTDHGVRGGIGAGGSEAISPRTIGSSVHGQTMHSVGSLSSKEDKAAAVKARLGLAPYEFPASSSAKDPLIVQQSNFFDGASDGGSDLGGKGENPEEC